MSSRHSNSCSADNSVQTLDTMQALCLPLGASISLLVMFFFFDSMQTLFAICTAGIPRLKYPPYMQVLHYNLKKLFLVIATVALAFLLLPMCQYLIRPCSDGTKISFGVCGRYTGAELLSFTLSIMIVCIWVLTGEFLFYYNIFKSCLTLKQFLIYHKNLSQLAVFHLGLDF